MGSKRLKKIVITGGHLTPAVAMIEELRRRGGWEIFFFGRKHAAEGDPSPSPESQIIAKLGIKFIPITAGRLQRRFTRWTIPSLFKIPIGLLQSFYWLQQIKPDVVFSFGGYLSVPVVFAGWILKIPSITHEQTMIKGLATSINSLFVKKVAVSWPESIGLFPKQKVVVTGNPFRKSFLSKPNEKIWKTLKYPAGLPLIFIGGSNQGSHVINLAVSKILPKLVAFTNVFHQCGHLRSLNDFEMLSSEREKLDLVSRRRYHVRPYIQDEEIAALMQKADLVVGRAGANFLTEICFLGKPALLIPIPWLLHDEQGKNARMVKRIGLAEILPQGQLTSETLLAGIKMMLKRRDHYLATAPSARETVALGAAKRLADLAQEQVK